MSKEIPNSPEAIRQKARTEIYQELESQPKWQDVARQAKLLIQEAGLILSKSIDWEDPAQLRDAGFFELRKNFKRLIGERGENYGKVVSFILELGRTGYFRRSEAVKKSSLNPVLRRELESLLGRTKSEGYADMERTVREVLEAYKNTEDDVADWDDTVRIMHLLGLPLGTILKAKAVLGYKMSSKEKRMWEYRKRAKEAERGE